MGGEQEVTVAAAAVATVAAVAAVVVVVVMTAAAAVVFSNWILTFCSPQRVSTESGNSVISKHTFENSSHSYSDGGRRKRK